MKYKPILGIEKLEQLSTERPESTTELFTPNDFYGHASILKQYCGLNQHFKLPGILPHGPRLNDEIWDLEMKHPLNFLLLSSKREQEIYSKQCSKPSIVIGSPFYYAKRLIESQLNEIGKHASGTIAFPLHSTHHVTNYYNHSNFVKYLQELPEEYHPVHICMYWRNIQIGNHRSYLDEGFQCTTAGHIFDKEFLLRLLKIFASHKYFITNEFGTSPIYAAAFGLPVTIIKQDYKRKCENPNLVADTPMPPDISLASCFNQTPDEDAVKAQREVAEDILGFKSLLQPAEMIKLFYRLVEKQQQMIPGLSIPQKMEPVCKTIRPKVIQVNDHQNTGGAATAGHRLFKGLIQKNADTHLITFAQPSQAEHRCLDWFSYFKELGCKPSNEFLTGQLDEQRKWYEIVSCVLEHENPDIINLHNIHEALHYRQVPLEILELMATKTRLILTLHDMWYFTGRCAYTGDCNRFIELSCNKKCSTAFEYPRLAQDDISSMFQRKLELFSRHQDVVIVCPSRWLAEEVKKAFSEIIV